MFNPFKFLKKKFESVPMSADTIAWMNPLGERRDFDYYTRWIFACAKTIAQSLAKVEWRLYKTSGKDIKEIDDHQLLSLLYQFNNRFTKYDSLFLSVLYFLLQGKSPWLLVGDGKPKEIWVVPPANLTIKKKDSKGYPILFEYGFGNNRQEVPAENVLYLRNPKPSDPTEGMSVIEAIRITADTDDYMSRWNKNILLRDMKPSGAVELEGTLNEKESKLLRKMVEETYGGFENAHRVMILANGAKFNPLLIPPKDLEFVKAREMNRDEILSIFGVPKILLGLESGYNRATAETAERVFAKYTLEPIMTMIVEQINEFLVPRFGSDLWLDFSPLSPEDREQMIAEFEKGWNKWLTANEIRNELGLESLDGGDELNMPLASQLNMPNKIIKSNSQLNINQKKVAHIIRKVCARNNRADRLGQDIADKIGNKIISNKKTVLRVKTKAVPTEKAKAWYDKSIIKDNELIKDWQDVMEKLFIGQKKRALANLRKLKRKKAKKDSDFENILDREEEEKVTVRIIEPEYYKTVMAGLEQAGDLVDREPVDLWNSNKIKRWIKYVARKYGSSVTDTTIEELGEILKSSAENQNTLDEMAEAIERYFDGISDVRAEKIAKTEVARAIAESHRMSWEEMGFKDVEWLLSYDPCGSCIDKSQRRWTIKTIEGEIPVHPNCQCRFTPL